MTAQKSESNPRYRWWLVFMLWWVCFFNYADRQSIFSVFPVLEVEMGFDKEQLGYIASAFAVIYAGAAPLAGVIADRFNRKRLILGGLIFWSVVTWGTAYARNFWDFYLIRALEGLGEAFYFPASMALLSVYHTSATRSRAMSFHQSSVYIGTVGGGVIGGWFAVHHGWRNGFVFFGAAGIILALILTWFIREPSKETVEQSGVQAEPKLPLAESFRLLLREPIFWLLLLVFFMVNGVATAFLSWAPTFLKEKFHLNLGMAGLTGTVFIHLSSVFGAPVGGWLADKWSIKNPAGRMGVQCLGLLVGAPFVYWTGSVDTMSHLIAAMIVFGFCKGLYDSNIFAAACDFAPPGTRATAVGLMNMVGWFGGGLTPIWIGKLAKESTDSAASLGQSLAFGGVVYVVAGILLLAGIGWVRRSRSTSRRGQRIGGVHSAPPEEK